MLANSEALITRSYPIPVAVIHAKSASTIGKEKAKTLVKKKRLVKNLPISHEDAFGEYLEHFGVKGMHWGVRHPKKKQLDNRIARVARGTDLKTKRVTEERKKKLVAGAAIGGALTATAIISSILTRRGMTPAAAVNSSTTVARVKYKAQSAAVDRGASMLKRVLEKNANKPISSFASPKSLKNFNEYHQHISRLKGQEYL